MRPRNGCSTQEIGADNSFCLGPVGYSTVAHKLVWGWNLSPLDGYTEEEKKTWKRERKMTNVLKEKKDKREQANCLIRCEQVPSQLGCL